MRKEADSVVKIAKNKRKKNTKTVEKMSYDAEKLADLGKVFDDLFGEFFMNSEMPEKANNAEPAKILQFRPRSD